MERQERKGDGRGENHPSYSLSLSLSLSLCLATDIQKEIDCLLSALHPCLSDRYVHNGFP
jgi:hypothetical protein